MASRGIGRGGRGALLAAAAKCEPPTMGRGFVRGIANLKLDNTSDSKESIQGSSEIKNKSVLREKQNLEDELERKREDDSKPNQAMTYHGSVGIPAKIISNHVRIKVRDYSIYQYHVSFSIDIPSKRKRYYGISQHKDALGECMIFDGTILFLPVEMKNELRLDSVFKDGSKCEVRIRKTKCLRAHECIQVYRLVMQRVTNHLQYTNINRRYFSVDKAAYLKEEKLEIWPGLVAAVHEEEDGVFLILDVSHKVLRIDTVYNVIQDLLKKLSAEKGPKNAREEITRALLGQVVMTRYNYKTYRIDDINFDMTPESTFESHGKQISFVQYYDEHYDIQIKDLNQPLLSHVPKKTKNDPNPPETILLVPELCHITGLTDKQRTDFKLMKRLAEHTRLSPTRRVETMQVFISNVFKNEKAMQELHNWHMELDDKPLQMNGRRLPEEKLMLGDRKIISSGPIADWSREITRLPMLRPVALNVWVLLVTQRDEGPAMQFLSTIKSECRNLAMSIAQPKLIKLRSDRTSEYIENIRKCLEDFKDTQMVMTIFPNSRDDRYNAVKKVCYCERGIPSQCLNARTVSDQRKVRSVTQKILMQMNVKLNGELWAVNLRKMKGSMYCGIDVFHDAQKRSVAGFVASSSLDATSWWSKACMQAHGQEIMDQLRNCLEDAIKNFHNKTNSLPTRIIIYRDGVGDGALKTIAEHEISQLRRAFQSFPDYEPQFSFIVVQKRINQRFLLEEYPEKYENPVPGTIIDHTVTRKDYFDFFLVSQNVRQGTVSPTHYIVLEDTTNLTPDQQQQLAYKMTHCYYNWPGAVRVPAPCQNAHKLAAMVGQNLRALPKECMNNTLFYL